MRHSYIGGERRIDKPHFPLAKMDGQIHLNTFGFENSADPFAFRGIAARIYSGKKCDAMLSIDGRSIPKGVFVNVAIGLLEPGKMEILDSLISNGITDIPFKSRRLMIVTDVKPWVYAILLW